MERKLRYGMVGGGLDALIGDGHRRSINLYGKAEIVAGCFSRSIEKNRVMSEQLKIVTNRCYADAFEMAKAEAIREDGIDFVVVVTPNFSLFDM